MHHAGNPVARMGGMRAGPMKKGARATPKHESVGGSAQHGCKCSVVVSPLIRPLSLKILPGPKLSKKIYDQIVVAVMIL